MTNEIKEILDSIKEQSKEENWIQLSPEFIQPLLDYITNLQQRIDKAIEYIRINKCNNNDINDCWHEDFKDILNILKGEEGKNE